MFVSDWMTRKVFTVSPDDVITQACSLIKDRRIKHIPVAKDGKLRGIISDRDIRACAPSAATSLDIYELHYLLEKTKVKEVMKSKVITTSEDTPVEEAALIMYDNNIGCLPVLDNGRLSGIISDRDIFRALVDITGVRHGGHRISMIIEDRPGSIREVADIIRKYGFHLQSILTSYEKITVGHRNIVIRATGAGRFGPLKAELMGSYQGVHIRKG